MGVDGSPIKCVVPVNSINAKNHGDGQTCFQGRRLVAIEHLVVLKGGAVYNNRNVTAA